MFVVFIEQAYTYHPTIASCYPPVDEYFSLLDDIIDDEWLPT